MTAALAALAASVLLLSATPLCGAEIAAANSERGLFRVHLRPHEPPIPINAPHNWTLRIETLGSALPPHEVRIDGGMPEHGHGLPAPPNVVPAQDAYHFLIEGMRFNMGGRWELRVEVLDARGWDRANLAFTIGDEVRPAQQSATRWSEAERAVLRSLWIGSLPKPRADPTNRVADDARAAAFGQRLFFDSGLSVNGHIACVNCHQPEHYFSDGMKTGSGLRQLSRNTPSVVGVAYASWFYWDGRRDSSWAQALVPLEAADEMGGVRSEVVRYIAQDRQYSKLYRRLFGPLPDAAALRVRASPIADAEARAAWNKLSSATQQQVNRAFANIGKAIAAYERLLVPAPARFDRYVDALLNKGEGAARGVLTQQEIAGLKLFIRSDLQCLNCHNGALFTNHGFHNIGTGVDHGEQPDLGRAVGLHARSLDEFNCQSPYNDAGAHACSALGTSPDDHDGMLNGAFKVPSLRNVARTAPYMHDGRYATLGDALAHYLKPPATRHELRPIPALTLENVQQLAAFLETLSGPIAAEAKWLRAP